MVASFRIVAEFGSEHGPSQTLFLCYVCRRRRPPTSQPLPQNLTKRRPTERRERDEMEEANVI